MSLKGELQSIDSVTARQAVAEWVGKMADLTDTPTEYIAEQEAMMVGYPLISAITVALTNQVEVLHYDEVVTRNIALGAKLALSALTEIAEAQALPKID